MVAGIILNSCIVALFALTVWLLRGSAATMEDFARHYTTCPICHRQIISDPGQNIMAPHTDKFGSTCPMSGQPVGATP